MLLGSAVPIGLTKEELRKSLRALPALVEQQTGLVRRTLDEQLASHPVEWPRTRLMCVANALQASGCVLAGIIVCALIVALTLAFFPSLTLAPMSTSPALNWIALVSPLVAGILLGARLVWQRRAGKVVWSPELQRAVETALPEAYAPDRSYSLTLPAQSGKHLFSALTGLALAPSVLPALVWSPTGAPGSLPLLGTVRIVGFFGAMAALVLLVPGCVGIAMLISSLLALRRARAVTLTANAGGLAWRVGTRERGELPWSDVRSLLVKDGPVVDARYVVVGTDGQQIEWPLQVGHRSRRMAGVMCVTPHELAAVIGQRSGLTPEPYGADLLADEFEREGEPFTTLTDGETPGA